jgi:nitroreductase
MATMTTINGRVADHPIEPMFLERWSPRAFTNEAIPQTELLTILEAGRWAPSSRNAQPWRFLYARRDTPSWTQFLDLLVPNNRAWAVNAAALVYLVSKTTMAAQDGSGQVPSPTHSLDAGAASAHLALQAHRLGWATHGMAGFDRQRLMAVLNVPDGYIAEAGYAIGRQGDPFILPEPLRPRERPSDRRPLAEIAFEGGFSTLI